MVVVARVHVLPLIPTLLLITLKTYRLHGLTILADQKILESMKILQFKLVAHCTHVLQLILLLRLMVIAVKHFGNMIQKQKQLNTLPVVVLVTMMRLRIKRFQKQIYKLLVFKPAHNEF